MKYGPHIWILPEDDADNDIVNGFLTYTAISQCIKVLPVAGGWSKVRKYFMENHINAMRRYAHRYMVLLVDFDKCIALFYEVGSIFFEVLSIP